MASIKAVVSIATHIIRYTKLPCNSDKKALMVTVKLLPFFFTNFESAIFSRC